MEKEIYTYIKKQKIVTVPEVAAALNLHGCEVLSTIENLRIGGYLKICPPVPLSLTNNSSCFYTVTAKKFEKA